MANITRYDPFNDLDDMFKGLFVRPMRFDLDVAPQMRMKLDVTRADDTYTVKADIPGVKKEDIQVTIEGNQVAISAEAKTHREQKDGEKLLRSERSYGKAYRAFTLAQDVDEASAEAKYVDGVLELTLPKKAVTSAKRLSVQ